MDHTSFKIENKFKKKHYINITLINISNFPSKKKTKLIIKILKLKIKFH